MADASQVCDWIERFVRSFDFNRPGVDRSLGRDLAHAVAGGIAARAADESRGADPAPWEENEPRYARRKRRSYGWDDAPNYRTGQMLSHASLLGEPVVEPARITMVYGTGEAPDGCWSPADNRSPSEIRADQSVTDRQKAAWTTEGGDSRPARPFYQLDDEIRVHVVEAAADALREYLLTGS